MDGVRDGRTARYVGDIHVDLKGKRGLVRKADGHDDPRSPYVALWQFTPDDSRRRAILIRRRDWADA